MTSRPQDEVFDRHNSLITNIFREGFHKYKSRPSYTHMKNIPFKILCKIFISDPIKPVSTAENSLMDAIRHRQENSKLMKLYKLKNGLQKRYLGSSP